MASVIRCDRCGIHHSYLYGTINGESVNEIIFARRTCDTHKPSGKFRMDLCPACVNELAEWLSAKKKENEDGCT